MTSERAQAYGRVTATLADVGPTKLQTDEQELVREAADTLLFCEDIHADVSAQEALDDIDELVERLVASERWTPERAEELRRDIEACGPAIAR
jgi:predicted HAD superfamily phosphohydrolase